VRQSAMSLRIFWRQFDGLTSYRDRFCKLLLRNQRIRKIDVGLYKPRFQLQSRTKVRDSMVGITLRQQDPPERVVRFGTTRSQLERLLECSSGARKIARF